jgi:hypothetical protein
MRWLIARYQSVSLFSLKHGEATSTGGKSLLVPTPFAIRTALLDVAIRVCGVAYGQEVFEHIRSLRLALRPPQRAAVTSIFAKILKPERDVERGRAMQRTIAFREYVHLMGNLELAFGDESKHLTTITPLLPHVSYLGKRGSFFQILAPLEVTDTDAEAVPEGFILLVGPVLESGQFHGQLPKVFPLGIIQRLDDWGPTLTFEQANIYSEEEIRLNQGRVRYDVVLPYRVTQAGRGFTVYERFS